MRRVSLIGATVAVAAAAVSVSATWNVAPATADSQDNDPGSASNSADPRAHCREVTPRVESGSLGEQIYHFDVPGAVDTIQVIPPKNFDFVRATAQQLGQLRVASRPDPGSESEAYRDWATTWSHPTFAPPGICVSDIPLAPAALYGGASTTYSGVRASNYAGHPYDGGYAQNRVFTSTGTCAGGTNGETSWVGLQSYTSGKASLLQAGTYRTDVANSGLPRAFYENISTSTTNQPNFGTGFSVSQGDLVKYTVEYFPANVTNSGKPEVFYFWTNMATNVTAGINSVLNASETWYNSTNNNVDFVDEAQYPIMKPFTSIGWAGAYVTTGTGPGDFPGNLPHTGWYLQHTNLIANLDNGLSTSSNWNNYHHACN